MSNDTGTHSTSNKHKIVHIQIYRTVKHTINFMIMMNRKRKTIAHSHSSQFSLLLLFSLLFFIVISSSFVVDISSNVPFGLVRFNLLWSNLTHMLYSLRTVIFCQIYFVYMKLWSLLWLTVMLYFDRPSTIKKLKFVCV